MDFPQRRPSPKSPVFLESKSRNLKRMDLDQENDEIGGHFFKNVSKSCQESQNERKSCLSEYRNISPRRMDVDQENDENCVHFFEKVHKSGQGSQKETKSSFVGIVSPAPRRKVLAERNGSAISGSPRSKVLLHHVDRRGETPMRNYMVCTCCDDGEIGHDIIDSSSYDPLTNYTTPRPQFLRYNPNKRQEILHRLEGEMEDSEGSQASSVSCSSCTMFSQHHEVEESEEEDSLEEKKKEEKRPLCFRLAWKLLLLIGLLAVLFCCISMNSSFPPLQESGSNGSIGLKVENERIDHQHGVMFTGDQMRILMGLSDVCLDDHGSEAAKDSEEKESEVLYGGEAVKDSEEKELVQELLEGVQLVKHREEIQVIKERIAYTLADGSAFIMADVLLGENETSDGIKSIEPHQGVEVIQIVKEKNADTFAGVNDFIMADVLLDENETFDGINSIEPLQGVDGIQKIKERDADMFADGNAFIMADDVLDEDDNSKGMKSIHQGVEGSQMIKEREAHMFADGNTFIAADVVLDEDDNSGGIKYIESLLGNDVVATSIESKDELYDRSKVAGDSSVEIDRTNHINTGLFQSSETESIDKPKSITVEGLCKIKDLAECILSSDLQTAASMILVPEVKDKFPVPDNSNAVSMLGCVFGLALNNVAKLLFLSVCMVIVFLARKLYKYLGKYHITLQASSQEVTSLSTPLDFAAEKFSIMVPAKKQIENNRYSYSDFSHELTDQSSSEAGRTSGTRPPTVRLLGEISVVEGTSATNKNYVSSTREVSSREKSYLSQYQRSSTMNNISSAEKVSALPSEDSSLSNISPVLKPLMEEDSGNKVEKKKRMGTATPTPLGTATPTPLRRSSRLRNQITSP